MAPRSRSSRRPRKARSVRFLASVIALTVGMVACSSHQSSAPHPPNPAPNGNTSSPSTTTPRASGSTATNTSATPSGGPATSKEIDRAAGVLEATARVGFDPSAPRVAKYATAPLGGLYLNWIGTWDGHGDKTANTNLNSQGQSDAQLSITQRHDPLTDLAILRDIYAWSQLYPGDHGFDTLEAQLSPIVRAEFTGYRTYRCWIYGQLVDLDDFDPGQGWSSLAEQFIAGIAKNNLDPATGAIIDPEHHGYRTDWAADCAGALTDAGQRFDQPGWITAGETAATYLVLHAQNKSTGLFPLQMTQQTGKPDSVADPLVKVGAEAQLLDGLLTVYDVTKDQAILDAVNRAVNALWNPAIGVHDPTHGGFFFGVNSDGTGVRTDYKESRQAWVLPMLQHLAAEGDDESTRIAEMRHVVVDLLWQPTMDGYPYTVAPNFTPYVHDGVTENWVTSEAMSIAADALLGLSVKDTENS